MNKWDRKRLCEIVSAMSDLESELRTMGEVEQEKYDNMPEGLQQSEQGERFESGAYVLESAADSVQAAIDELEGVE